MKKVKIGVLGGFRGKTTVGVLLVRMMLKKKRLCAEGEAVQYMMDDYDYDDDCGCGCCCGGDDDAQDEPADEEEADDEAQEAEEE